MADHKALEQQLGCEAVVPVDALQDFARYFALAQVALKRDASELKLVLGEGPRLVTEDVVDATKLLGELQALCFTLD